MNLSLIFLFFFLLSLKRTVSAFFSLFPFFQPKYTMFDLSVFLEL